MKHLITSTILLLAINGFSQVIFEGLSPSSITGLYDFTHNGEGPSWGLDNLDDPADAIEGELMFVEDGTPGTNAQGHPISQEGCFPLINDLTGKIAVIYRNTCLFGEKALYAQNAGAIGVIIISQSPGFVIMNGATNGLLVTIPVTMISDSDGARLVNEMTNGPVRVFIGNKLGYYAHDMGSYPRDVLIAKSFSTPLAISSTSADYSFDLGINTRNYGNLNQIGVTVTATVEYNNSSVYSETSNPFNLASGDSVFINFSTFSLPTYSPGRYTLKYQINTPQADEELGDNQFETDFIINDTIFSLSPLESATNLPISTFGYMPSSTLSSFSSCIHFQNANADRLLADGLYFSAMNFNSLSEKEVKVKVLEIVDDFTDWNDAPSNGIVNTSEISSSIFTYPIGSQSDFQNEAIYVPFMNALQLENDKRYLFCVQSINNDISINYSDELNYEMNNRLYEQPLAALEIDGIVNLRALGIDSIPAIGVKMSPLNTTTTSQQSFIECAGFSVTVGNNTYTESGTYIAYLQGANGNDSIVTTILTIKQPVAYSQYFAEDPGFSIIVGTHTYTSPGVYTDILIAANGCDSVITTTIDLLDLTVNTDGSTISTDQTGGTYQWIDCINNVMISNATNQSFAPFYNSSYAVIITINGVSDTSECYVVTFSNLQELKAEAFFSVSPNPNKGAFKIQSTLNGNYLLVSDLGQTIYQGVLTKGTNEILLDDVSTGVYYIIGSSESGIERQKIVVIK